MKQTLIDPFIPRRLNPKLSTPGNPVFEDDTRYYLPPPKNPNNLMVAMDFFDPLTDEHFDYIKEKRQKLGLPVEMIPFSSSFESDSSTNIVGGNNLNVDYVTPTIHTADSSSQNQNLSQHHNKRIPCRPIDIVERLISVFHFRVFEKSLYFYNNRCYEYISKDDFKTLFLKIAMCEFKRLADMDDVSKVFDVLVHYPELQIESDDVANNLVAFKNTIFDTKTFSLMTPTPQIFSTFQINCNYTNFYHPCLNFENFLEDVTGGDNTLKTRIWEFLGYCLTADTKAKKIFVLQGLGDTGKSVLSNLLKSLYPSKTFSSLSVTDLENNFAAADLFGKHLCLSGDMPSHPFGSKAVSILKKISGNDPINCDRKYQSRAEMECKARFVLASNHPISLTYSDEPFIKRLVVIPFCHPISPEKRDPDLLNKLIEEKDSIAMKALCFYKQLVDNNYEFTGDFPVNSSTCFQYLPSETNYTPTDIPSEIQLFLFTNVEASDNNCIPVDELHKKFEKMFHPISINHFSTLCRKICETSFLATKKKMRIDGCFNPVHVIAGIKWTDKTKENL